jgi:acyl carrier protein
MQNLQEVLLSHSGVTDADVISIEELSSRPVVVAAVEGQVSGAEIHQHMRRTLGASGIPETIVILPALPRDHEGCLDTDALLQQIDALQPVYRFVPPGSDLERWLTSLWESAIGEQGIGIEDDFFDAGGHSVSAISILTEISAAVGVQFTLEEFFGLQKISCLAAAIEAQGRGPVG